MVQFIRATPRTSFGTQLGEAIGGGLGKGMSQATQLSLQQKMNALEDQRKINQHMAVVKSQADTMRKMGGDYAPIADIWEGSGGNEALTKLAIEYSLGGTPKQNAFQGGFQGPSQQPNAFQNLQALQQQGTGLPQYDMAVGQGSQPQMTQPAQSPKTQEQENIQQLAPQYEGEIGSKQTSPFGKIPPLLEYARKLDPRFDGMKGPARDKVLANAEKLRNADVESEKSQMAKETLEETKEQHGFQRHKEFITKMNSQYAEAKKKIAASDHLINLVKTHRLTNPLIAKAAELGGMEKLLSPETQEFNAGLKIFLSGLKSTFGSKPTNMDTQIFGGLLPSIYQWDEGKEVLAKMLKITSEADMAEAKAYNEVMKKNKGKYPYDLEMQVNDMADKEVSEKWEELKKLPFVTAGKHYGFDPVQQGTKISVDVVDKFLDAFPDYQLARKVAESLGYEGM